MTVLIFLVLAIHGLIHILGFLHAWKLVELPGFTGATLFASSPDLAKPMGVLWLLACAAFLCAALLSVLHRRDGWWKTATFGVLLSQLLIIHAWPDAKFGTLANIFLVFAIVVAAADRSFRRETAAMVREMTLEEPLAPGTVVSRAELDNLPEVVQRWLLASGVVGRPRVQAVHLHQTGWLRTAPRHGWMPARAEQYFTIREPGFIWQVDVRMKRILPIVGRDAYRNGHGSMLIKLAALLPLVRAKGDAIDEGSLLRFLGEMVWFPSAALEPYMRWEAVDSTSARATLTHRGASASATFTFDEQGSCLGVRARRFMGGGPQAKREWWWIPITKWGQMQGLRIPTGGDVIWQLEQGDFSYYRWELTAITYDEKPWVLPPNEP